MKKSYLFMVAAAVAMTVASCGQKPNKAQAEAEAPVATDTVAVVADSAACVADSAACVADSAACASDSVVAE